METISFAGEGIAAELAPADLADCAATVLEADGKRILSYGTGAGYTPLRELLAEQLGVHPHRVLLTNGWLQGFSLLAQGRVWRRGIVVEYPTYDRLLRAIFSLGARALYVDVRDDGLAFDALEVHLRTNLRPALAYTIPAFHNPTGQSLPVEQRQRLWALLRRAGTPVVEDDSYGLLRFEGESLPTLFELSGGETIYSTSFSCTIAPGLRVGVFVLPDELAGELAQSANNSYIAPSLLAQATVFEFLSRGGFDAHLEALRRALAERRDLMLAAIAEHLPEASCRRPEGGIFLLLRLPAGIDAKALVESADGVEALAGLDFGGPPNAIRLNFAGVDVEEIEPGVERLGAALRARQAAATP